MKIILALSILLSGSLVTSSQTIKYEKSWENALRRSQEEHKPLALFLTITSSITNYSRVLQNQALVEKFNSDFVNYTIDRSDTSSSKLIRQYKVTGFPSIVFIDSRGGLMFKDVMAPIPNKIIEMADKALTENKSKSLVEFDKEYIEKAATADFLKQYILKRRKAGISDNGNLIEEYAELLRVADLAKYDEVLFIMTSGPVVNSKAHRLAYLYPKIVDSIFKTELSTTRSAINNAIINNTMASAIAAKNFSTAIAAASFARGTWTKDYVGGQKSYASNIIRYYSGIKDTSNFLRQTVSYYDMYYMNISADSVRKMDERSREKAKSRALENAQKGVPEGGALTSFSVAYPANTFATELNNGAWSVYNTGTKNPAYLTKALLWSKRSIELNPVYGYYDTLAHLLYRLGFYKEAESTQETAIKKAEAEGRKDPFLYSEFAKIKKRAL